MNESEKKDLVSKSDAGLIIVPGKYQQVYSVYRDEIDCFLRAYVLLRGVPGINMERDTAGGNYGRYFFPTSEFNILHVMNAIRERIKPGREPFTYSDLRDMAGDLSFCETNEKPMIYRSVHTHQVSRKNTDSPIPLEADNRILTVREFDLAPIEEIAAKENEPAGEVPKPQLSTVSDYFAFDSSITRAKSLYDQTGYHFVLFWLKPTSVEGQEYCSTRIPSSKSSITSSMFSSMLRENLWSNSSLSEYLSDLGRAGFPVYPIAQLLLNTGENNDSCRKGYLVHRTIADKIQAAVDPEIANAILRSQGHPKIREQIANLTEKLRLIEDLGDTTLSSSISEGQYTCKDLIEELVGKGVARRTRLGNIRLNEQRPRGYLGEKKDEILSRMNELFRNFFELPLSEILEAGYLTGGQEPSGYLPE